jgi:hypothetical protein
MMRYSVSGIMLQLRRWERELSFLQQTLWTFLSGFVSFSIVVIQLVEYSVEDALYLQCRRWTVFRQNIPTRCQEVPQALFCTDGSTSNLMEEPKCRLKPKTFNLMRSTRIPVRRWRDPAMTCVLYVHHSKSFVAGPPFRLPPTLSGIYGELVTIFLFMQEIKNKYKK